MWKISIMDSTRTRAGTLTLSWRANQHSTSISQCLSYLFIPWTYYSIHLSKQFPSICTCTLYVYYTQTGGLWSGYPFLPNDVDVHKPSPLVGPSFPAFKVHFSATPLLHFPGALVESSLICGWWSSPIVQGNRNNGTFKGYGGRKWPLKMLWGGKGLSERSQTGFHHT